MLAALIAAGGAAMRPAAAGDPVPLETPDTVAEADSTSATPAAAAMAPGVLAPPFAAKLARPPLEPPLTINGGFGEYRPGHFHAGVDLGTGGRVGKPVHAPLPGYIARVRTSGVGYGRSVYLQVRDGRLLQFGHLDAFEEPLASYVAAVQESTGQYEQDLWLEASRYPVKVGDRIAWTGESGAGGPHLHFEVRRGDMALNPFRAGLTVPDRTPPTLTSLTLEPLDDTSFVARCAAPYTMRFGARRETLLVQGRVRAVVGAFDGAGSASRRIVPWSVSESFEGRTIECRFDSLSWATDMPEGDYVFDAGRVVGGDGLVLWAPPGFRPRVIRTDAPRDQEAGTIVVRPGDPPRRLEIVARDVAGNRTRRAVTLRGPRASERGPDTTRVGGRATAVDEAQKFEFAALPGGLWRVIYRGAPPGSRGLRLRSDVPGLGDTTFAFSTRGADWAVVIAPSRLASWHVFGRDADGGPWLEDGPGLELARELERPPNPRPELQWSLPRDASFERALAAQCGRAPAQPAPPELSLIRIAGRLEPEELPLRHPAHVLASLRGVADTSHVGLYRHDPDGWSYLGRMPTGDGVVLGPTREPAHYLLGLEADSRRLGTFALFADTLAPRIVARTPPRVAPAGPYSTWALEARLTEEGSGVDPAASAFEVDGVRVPSEWDAEESTLRWRPHHAPAQGTHRYTVVAVDRAGNVAKSSGTFVLD